MPRILTHSPHQTAVPSRTLARPGAQCYAGPGHKENNQEEKTGDVIHRHKSNNIPGQEKRNGPGSSVGTATGYGLDGPWIESRRGRDFPHLSRSALGPTRPTVQWYRVFPGVKSGRGLTLTHNPFLVPWSRKARAIRLPPLWAVRPVQSLSACTRVTFTFIFTFLHYFNMPYFCRVQVRGLETCL